MKQKPGGRTLLMSVVMSAPGPLIMGIGLLSGRSSTQLADFFRRSAELLGIICAYVVFKMTQADGRVDEMKKARLERFTNLFVGAVMVFSGAVMLLLALFSEEQDKGNVVPGLVIALLGVIANTLFWRKYTRLNRQTPNAILAVQSRLYRAKALVDACVTTALTAVALYPHSKAAAQLDTLGSVVVAAYLIWCGAGTVLEQAHPQATCRKRIK